MNKLKPLLLPFCLLMTAAILTSCKVNGKGEITTGTFELAPFTGIVNNISADVHITQAATQTVDVVAQKNIIDNMKLEVTDGTLNIGFKKDAYSFEPININISIPELSSLTINGSGNMNTTNTFDSCGSVLLTISGSGNISAWLNASAKTYSTIKGSGNISLNGFSPAHDISISGSGDVTAFPFHTYHTVVDIAGSGDCELRADSTLGVNISGSGNVYYKGYPVINSSITGSGSVNNGN
jgi:hypothetical protein